MTAADRCERSELPPAQCAHCLGHDDTRIIAAVDQIREVTYDHDLEPVDSDAAEQYDQHVCGPRELDYGRVRPCPHHAAHQAREDAE